MWIKGKKRAFIVTDKPLFDLGYTKRVTDVLDEEVVCVEDVSALVVTSCGDVIGNVYLYDKEFKKINYLDIK